MSKSITEDVGIGINSTEDILSAVVDKLEKVETKINHINFIIEDNAMNYFLTLRPAEYTEHLIACYEDAMTRNDIALHAVRDAAKLLEEIFEVALQRQS